MKKLVYTLIALLVVVAGVAIKALYDAGQFRSIENKVAGQCRRVDGPAGAEDVEIVAADRVAYLAADDRRATWAGDAEVRGAIWRYDLAFGGLSKLDDGGKPETFHPHGFNTWRLEDGKLRFFVINHPTLDSSTVELFDLDGDRLVHVETIADSAFVSLNDIVATGPRGFYATNDSGAPAGVWNKVGTYLQFPWSSLAQWDERGGSKVVTGLTYGNGVAVTADGSQLYIAEVVKKRIRLYDRDPASGSLKETGEILLDFGPDNLAVAADGALWTAGHPKMLDFVAHAADPAEKSPSAVARIARDPAGFWVAEEVLVDDGAMLSASSSAAAHGRRLLVSGVFDPAFLDCWLTPENKVQ